MSIDKKDESDDSSYLKKLDISPDSKENSKKIMTDQLEQLKHFYDFKRYFNKILRIKPLMIGVSDTINEDIIKKAKTVGFY